MALLHARTADVCKMITVVEQAKRVLREEGRAYYQYNQLFELPAKTPSPRVKNSNKSVIEETILEKSGDGGGNNSSGSDEDHAFEPVQSRLQIALLPPPPSKAVKSLRVFLSTMPIPELQLLNDVTVQFSEEKTT